jgi:type I restriction enzyme, S subunit
MTSSITTKLSYKNWTRVIIEDVVEHRKEKAMPDQLPNVKFIGMDCISPNAIRPSFFYDFSNYKSAGNVFGYDDVLYGRLRPYLNKVYKAEIEGVCSGEFIVLIPSSILFSKYLLYNLHSKKFVDYANLQVTGERPRISFNKISKYSINLPPLPEQRAIVSKIEQLFSDLDNGIENFKKAQEQLKIYRQSVLKNACEGKLVPTEAELARAEGRDYEPANVLLARILKERREKWNGKGKYKEPAAPDTTELPELPEGWCLANVGQITDSMKNGIYKPKEFYAEEGFACLRMYNIDRGKIVWKDIKRMNLTKEEIDEYLLVPGDLLVNRVNSRELVGKAAVISSGIEKCVFESKNIRVRILNEVVNPYYLCYHFTLAGTDYFNRNAQQVVGMASISQPQIARFPVLLPPLAEQHCIVTEVERRLSICDKLQATIAESLQKAESLRQSILKKAFEGKLLNEKELEEARNAPDWEPAEKLLERIKAQKNN